MKIQTFSVLVGSKACNARCPYCVSKMTPAQGIGLIKPEVNWRNFKVGCRLAKDAGVSTILLTGKGEPTLFPGEIADFLKYLYPYNFPFLELQTNGIAISQNPEKYGSYLAQWYELGLTTVAISVVHYDNAENQKIYQPDGAYLDLPSLIFFLHSAGLSVRLTCMMLKGMIDNVVEVRNFINFAKDNKVEQLTIRPIEAPKRSEDAEVAQWAANHRPETENLLEIGKWIEEKGEPLLHLAHGAVVYDVDGQNVCLSNCLTSNVSPDEVRQLIFFPDGHLRYDWQYPGAILL